MWCTVIVSRMEKDFRMRDAAKAVRQEAIEAAAYALLTEKG